ncbi:MAG: FAD:protein FMN transferase [Planctomycetes bacterium]|nr:FAD:protein FMN transferase [Planctomycetota bacterium]
MKFQSVCWWSCLFVACSGPEIVVFGGPTMGSSYTVKYVASPSLDTVQGLVADELAAADQMFSHWRQDSEIARCNADRSGKSFAVSPRFRAVLAEALRIAEQTDGAFDPTVKPLVDLYRDSKRTGEAPSQAAIAAARARVGWQRVRLDGVGVVREQPDIELDLDGLVAGVVADAIAERLTAAGVTAFFLDITGEVLCRGHKPDGEPWRIGVVDPDSDEAGGGAAAVVVPVRDQALCTSGDYRNVVQIDGKRLHHIFDPRTGVNATHDVVSVSVLTRSAALADALGTALMVIGEPGAMLVAQRFADAGPIGLLFLSYGPDGRLRQTRVGWPE